MKFVAAERSLKKRMLLDGTSEKTRDGWKLDLHVGPKFSLGQWLQSSAGRGATHAVMVQISEII
jgi:hypothetical protein